jgi:hypothetical protein
MPDKQIAKYLDHYAESEAALVVDLFSGFFSGSFSDLRASELYEHCLIIPTRSESWAELKRAWQHLTSKLLVILVINTCDEKDQVTQKLLADTTSASSARTANLYLSRVNSFIDCLVVDRTSTGNRFSSKEGVGLARKIGADIALTLISRGVIRNTYINNTDADAILPPNYFELTVAKHVSAIVRPFRHISRSKSRNNTERKAHHQAVLLYEISLRYYVNRLAYAKSLYAFHTIGSTISVNARDYALVRGTPKRLAGEDFYLLNKLAKTGAVFSAPGDPITLDARISHRTPFGTGSSIDRILSLDNPLTDYLYYQPNTFEQLKTLLTKLPLSWQQTEIEEIFVDEPYLRDWGLCTGAFKEIAKQRRQIRSESVFLKFLTDWLDGFRTLKFVHFMRDNHFPSKPIGWICQQTLDLGTQSVEGIFELEKIQKALLASDAAAI